MGHQNGSHLGVLGDSHGGVRWNHSKRHLELRIAYRRPYATRHRSLERRDDGPTLQRRVLEERDPDDASDSQESGAAGAREVRTRLRDGHVLAGEARAPRLHVIDDFMAICRRRNRGPSSRRRSRRGSRRLGGAGRPRGPRLPPFCASISIWSSMIPPPVGKMGYQGAAYLCRAFRRDAYGGGGRGSGGARGGRGGPVRLRALPDAAGPGKNTRIGPTPANAAKKSAATAARLTQCAVYRGRSL